MVAAIANFRHMASIIRSARGRRGLGRCTAYRSNRTNSQREAMIMKRAGSGFVTAVCVLCFAASSAAQSPDFAKDVAPIFTKYCTGCHNDSDREGKLSLESYASLLKGGAKGGVVTPGQAE